MSNGYYGCALPPGACGCPQDKRAKCQHGRWISEASPVPRDRPSALMSASGVPRLPRRDTRRMAARAISKSPKQSPKKFAS